MSSRASVVVIGAGPVGLTLAADLARFGVATRIVDKAPERSRTSKALVLWSRSLELLDRMGCGGRFVAAGHRVHAASIFAGSDRIGHIGFDHVASPHPYALMLPQSETERLLDEHLTSLGTLVDRAVEMTRLVAGADGVTLDLRDAAGQVETVTCDWLVGCDGAHSTVRHALDMGFVGSTLPSHWILADVHLEGSPVPESEIGLFWNPDGVLAFFPITPGRYRVIADVATDGPTPTLADVQALIDRRGPPGLVVSDAIWLSSFRINERKVSDYSAGRVFLAGDAAHVHSPAGGQGMNTGMQDAANLAWKLALVVRGEARPEPLLASYSAERSAVGEIVLRNAGRMTSLATLRNPTLQSIRDHLAHALFGFERVRDTMADTLSEVSIHYTTGSLVTPGSVQAGPRSGEGLSLGTGETGFGTGNAPRFTLCAGAAAEADAMALVGRYPRLIAPAIRPPLAPGGVWLVRPDGYVAVAATAGTGVDRVSAYLDRLVP